MADEATLPQIFTPDEAKAILRDALAEFVGRKATPEVLEAIRRKMAATMEAHDGMWVLDDVEHPSG